VKYAVYIYRNSFYAKKINNQDLRKNNGRKYFSLIELFIFVYKFYYDIIEKLVDYINKNYLTFLFKFFKNFNEKSCATYNLTQKTVC